MDWIDSIHGMINYIEEHLEEEISLQELSERVHISPFYLQRGFSLMTGYGIGEYLRCRRLYQAALDLKNSDDKVIDIALRYCYENPESFTKAFSRFHGVSPSQLRAGAPFRTFLPLTVNITLQGGNKMNYSITKMFPFKVIGFERVFRSESANREIPLFWDEICEKYAANVYAGNPPANPWEKALIDNCIGEYGICIDDRGEDSFRYLIAGKYTGGEVPEGMALYEFPGGEWAVFNCVGPVPEALQSMNERIFSQWLPANPDYEICGNANVEWYDCVNGEKTDPDYHSAVWVPVRKKE